MRKFMIAFLLVTLLISITPLNAFAESQAEPLSIKSVSISPNLSFSGSTAECKLTVTAANVTDSVSATMKLWRGSTLLATWTGSSTWILNMSKTKTVTSGYTYKLTADVKINGVAQPTVSVSKYH